MSGQMSRRHSDTALHALALRQIDPEHLNVDVEMCAAIWELRLRERELAERSRELQAIESSIFRASGDLIDELRSRRARVTKVSDASKALVEQIERLVEDIEDDPKLSTVARRMQYLSSEDTGTGEFSYDLGRLRDEWLAVKDVNEKRRRDVVEVEQRQRPWWAIWR